MFFISVDVEEYFHASNLEPLLPPRAWHCLPSRVERSTHLLLDLFDSCSTKGTFFILGCTARRHPRLVLEIAARGHEIASHGYGHRLAYTQSQKSFRRDILRSKLLLEDQSGQAVEGYRAPNFSVSRAPAWSFEELVSAGYRYDSSIHPIHHPRYGNTHQLFEPTQIDTPSGALTEIPIGVLRLPSLRAIKSLARLPCGGGAYWRLFPECWTNFALRTMSAQGRTGAFYLHPWEFDPYQPRISALPYSTRLRHYYGLSVLEKRVQRILSSFPFFPLREYFTPR